MYKISLHFFFLYPIPSLSVFLNLNKCQLCSFVGQKTLVSLSYFSHTPSLNPSANSISLTLKICPEYDQVSTPPSLLQWSKFPSSIIWINSNNLLTELFVFSLSPHWNYNVSVKIRSNRSKSLHSLLSITECILKFLVPCLTRLGLIWSSPSLGCHLLLRSPSFLPLQPC